MEMSSLWVQVAVVSVLVSLIILVIAIGSLIILSNSWFGRDTKERLTSLETGQKNLNERMAKLEEGQDKLEEGQAKLNDYVESELHRMHGLLEKIMDTVGELAKQHSKK